MKIKASLLKQNFNLYPREKLDEYNLLRIKDALEIGIELPPIIADKKTKIVIDGFHRIAAFQSLYGLDTEVPVVFKEYSNVKDMFLDAVKLNSSQGKPLDVDDRLHCRDVSKRMRIKPAYLAEALFIKVDRIGDLALMRFESFNSIKQDPIEERSKNLNNNSLKNRKSKTDRQLFYVGRIISILENDEIDLDNKRLFDGFFRLKKLLNVLNI